MTVFKNTNDTIVKIGLPPQVPNVSFRRVPHLSHTQAQVVNNFTRKIQPPPHHGIPPSMSSNRQVQE
jgi:hypothetical protein